MSNNMIVSVLVFVLISGKLPQIINAKTVYVLSTKMSYNCEYVENYRVHINPGNTSVDITLTVPRTYKRDTWLELAINSKIGNTHKFRRLLQYDINICQLWGKGKGKFLTAWVENFMNYGDLPKSCPIKEGNYSWRNITLETRYIPSFVIASAQYEIWIRLYFKNRSQQDTISNTTIIVEIK